MLDAGERAKARARVDAAGQRDGRGGSGVGEVVGAAQAHLDALAVVQERPVADLQRRDARGRAPGISSSGGATATSPAPWRAKICSFAAR